ncbi:MAG: hypothetical protein KIY12_01870 [Thermoplasmata archaeon]|uniref:Uncharacterized protein n=1 Tax=Candidatus Sysuiplasma superficiale TaxID=2823368 RepID=A0A8J8CB62_9ARCH|nr:hypothetical protein [Candidatus Sysuiplasma superficiale]MBX8643465.1 hypothetical protein [Candidatus Sysuiplasma superficiale]MCL4346669.1 hypothetical protein [Candidatus Thermoplasmatota archaeon]
MRSFTEYLLEKADPRLNPYVLLWIPDLAHVWLVDEIVSSGYSNLHVVSSDSNILRQKFNTYVKCWYSCGPMTHLPDCMYRLAIYLPGKNSTAFNAVVDELMRVTESEARILIVFILAGKGSHTESSVESMSCEVSSIFRHAAEATISSESYVSDRLSVLCFNKRPLIGKAGRVLSEVNIVCPFLGRKDGIGEYTSMLASRFRRMGVNVNLSTSFEGVNLSLPTVLEYERNMKLTLPSESRIVIECHSLPFESDVAIEMQKHILLLRQTRETIDLYGRDIWLRAVSAYYIFRNDPLRHSLKFLSLMAGRIKCMMRIGTAGASSFPEFSNYYLMPHINYDYPEFNNDADSVKKSDRLCIGTFGFAAPYKRVEKICRLAEKLGVPCKVLLSVSDTDENFRRRTERHAKRIMNRCVSRNVNVEVGFFTPEELFRKLSSCTHILFSQVSVVQSSGSMRLASALHKPVVSSECFQAMDAQAYTVRRIEDIDIQYLSGIDSPNRPDDGFTYLFCILRNLASSS